MIKEMLINAVILSVIAFATIAITDKKFNKLYLVGLALSLAITIPVAKFNATLMGVIFALIPALIIHIMYKKKIYTAYMFYISYLTYYIADLVAGVVFTNLLKINLPEYFTKDQQTLVFGIAILIVSAPLAWLHRYIANKKIRIKIIEAPKSAEYIICISLMLALFVHARAASHVQTNGMQANMVRLSLLGNGLFALIVMYGLFYIIQACIPKSDKADEISTDAKKLTEVEKDKVIESIVEPELKEKVKDLFK